MIVALPAIYLGFGVQIAGLGAAGSETTAESVRHDEMSSALSRIEQLRETTVEGIIKRERFSSNLQMGAPSRVEYHMILIFVFIYADDNSEL